MKNSIIFSSILAAGLAAGFTSCSDVDYPDSPSAPKAENVIYDVDGRAVTISWTLPQGREIKGVQILRDGVVVATLEGPATTYTDRRATPGEDVRYTVKVMYADGTVSEGITVHIDIISTERTAMLLPCALPELTDDDEIYAANWFTEEYGDKGVVLTPDRISSLTVKDNPVVWINVDREGLPMGWQNLPAPLVAPEVLEALRSYIDAGGHVYLTKHATQMTVPLGFLEEQFAPRLFASGAGGEGSDIWTMNCNIGLIYDHYSSPLFAGLTTCDVFTHPTIPLIGPGWREDHNCMWDLNSYSYTVTADNTVLQFEQQNDCTVMATWGQVVDFAVAGMLQFADTEGRLTCVANGLAAYEFCQPGGNEYQANIDRLTRNCLDELSK